MSHSLLNTLGACALLAAVSSLQGQITNGGGATATSLTVSTLSTGTSLQVSAAVSPDGRYVGVEADPMFSTLEGIDTFIIPTLGVGTTLRMLGVGGAGRGARGVPFRPAQIGKVVFVERDKPLLVTRTPALALKGTSLKAAVRRVADATRSNIVLGIRGLEEAGVDTNVPHDFSAPAGTTKETLMELLKVAAPETDMVITAEDRVIQIATQTQADNTIVTKSYYMEDLLANLPRFVPAETNLNAIGKHHGKPLVDAKPLDFSKPPPEAGSYDYDATLFRPVAPPRKPGISTTITDLITSTVRPEIWKVNGGKIGEIAVVGNHVTIRAPQSVHALLDGPSHYNPNKVSSYVGYQP